MRASRLLALLILLQLRQRLTAEALAQEFEVSVRTIYRDIDALSAAGIPVYGERGVGGGFQLLDGYRTRLTGLAHDETEAMMMIGLPGAAADLGLSAAAARARGKLLAALPGQGGRAADRLAQRFHLDPTDWYRAAEPAPWLPRVARAVLDQRMLAMDYESWQELRARTVAPLGLVQKAGSWYLVGRTGAGLRTYKVANIRSLTTLEESFDSPDGFDLARHWAESLAQFEQRLRPLTVQLQLSATGCARLARLGAYAAAAVAAAVPGTAAGWQRVDLPAETIEQASLLLLGLGAEVTVEAPEALRAAMLAEARQIARRMTRAADMVPTAGLEPAQGLPHEGF